MTNKPTQNAAAYDAYLRGLAIEHDSYNYDAYSQAERVMFTRSQLDPNFALAWARLSVIRSFLYFNSIDLTTNSAAAVKEAADRAMALAPEAGESWIAKGSYRYRVLRDFDGAVAAYRKRKNGCRTVHWFTNISRSCNVALANGTKRKQITKEHSNSIHVTSHF